MSARAVTNRQILHNITNMDDSQPLSTTADKSLGDGDGGVGAAADGGIRDVNGVVKSAPRLDPTPLNELAGGRGSPSRGENVNKKPRKTGGKFESGSGSGEQDAIDNAAAKKRKTRRGKPKHRKLKPYLKQQLSYGQRVRLRGIGSRVAKTGRQPTAPYNTTQFLMEDHSDLPDLEQKLAAGAGGEAVTVFQKPSAPPRTRDSSFSIDSDEDYFYSSPEDEEEFLTKEFSTAYEDLHAERLGGLTKTELIQEYIQLESKVELLTKRLRGKNFCQMEELEVSDTNGKYPQGAELEIARKLKHCQQRIDDLIQQNEQLRRENDALKGQRRGSVASTIDSESDSDSDTSTNSSSCSCAGDSPVPSANSVGNSQTAAAAVIGRKEQRRQTNGYGSSTVPADSSSCVCLTDSDSELSSSNGPENDGSRLTEATPGDRSATPPLSGNIISNGNATSQEVNGLPT
ncbi:protein HEXIM1 [Neodiprion pinetum]|uniref:Protein HEXIM1 n=1 Tax=Neodiprion lecontei TaxID=441921 RepID=A0ABM3G9M5_NEOLC|nr:protein HEXIM1-like [Neodiprion fabricii]XP_046483860.1 protein HEXIM1-like [Neodiprion pinetum]XP_046596974.1 protein HEXIM1 [Neodiprion lecontei]XP_046620882.1 protein HEXIM1-like [Neodiprion virginianus]